MHQDHRVIHEEGVRAFRHVTVWGYEMPWNQIRFSSDALVELEQRHLDKQWEALQCYESQLAKESLYLNKEYAQSLARVRGSQIKSQFAESYEVIRVRW
jgi:LmbE family N-acetylglucosaminyl deacetylase